MNAVALASGKAVERADPSDHAMALIMAAERALEQATEIGETLRVRDRAKELEVLTRLASAQFHLAQRATILRLRTERRIGRWLTLNLNHGRPEKVLTAVTLPDLGITRNESSRWQAIGGLPDERFNEWVDDHLAKGWDISGAGLYRFAMNHDAKANGHGRPRMATLLLHVQPGTCALYGYMIECSGGLEGHHLISKDMARGNDELRDLLRTCPPELMSQVCTAHNVGKLADSHNARRILLLQKVYEYGLVHMWQYVNALPWKVRMPEDRFEAMLEPKEVKT